MNSSQSDARSENERAESLPPDGAVTIDYTNYRGERALRTVLPIRIWFGSTAWHPDKQWLLEARDLDREVARDFALADIHHWSSYDGVEADRTPKNQDDTQPGGRT